MTHLAEIVGHFDSELQDEMNTGASSKHGKGMGCIPADHMQEVGQRSKTQSDHYTGVLTTSCSSEILWSTWRAPDSESQFL